MKVGIVVVSYNAAKAVKATLASLHLARNHVPYALVLIDNASALPERHAIEQAFNTYAVLAADPWSFMPQENNLGFSGGNNLGIRYFLEQEDITHICLLNADVIVTDHWLDRLCEKQVDFLSAVTNKADSTQSIPVPYDLSLDQVIDGRSGELLNQAIETIQAFADWRYQTWHGHLVEADVTFFMVLLRRRIIERLGLLDEQFFPGGYEDNDYCLRARAAGVPIHLARDVFIHHWGSASFGQLPHEYFSERAGRNIAYLEDKHGIKLERHPESPWISYAMDMLEGSGISDRGQSLLDYHQRYDRQLTALAQLYASELVNLDALLKSQSSAPPEALRMQIQSLRDQPSITKRWQRISQEVRRLLTSIDTDAEAEANAVTRSQTDLQQEIRALAQSIRDLADCNQRIHAQLQAAMARPHSAIHPVAQPPSAFNKLTWLLGKGWVFIRQLRGVVFFGGYPYPERQSDGYFQRIQIIDSLLVGHWRVYVETTELVGRDRWFDRPAEQVLVLRVLGGPLRRIFVRLLAVFCALRCGRVYFHSVLRMRDSRFGLLLHLPWLRRVTDIHGVVPEEFRLHNDFYSALLFEREERSAVRRSHLVIVVTEAMEQYLRQKYRDQLRAQVVSFPMFPELAVATGPRPYQDGKPVVVYAGGLHKWQQVPKMLDAIERTIEHCQHRFYCTDPAQLRAQLPESIADRVEVDRKPHAELLQIYEQCHFGFLLREDHVVNHVACPTKVVEYLGKGIVPILDSENIGDFKALGMRFVRLQDFVAGLIPSEQERDAMARDNQAVYERLKQARDRGAQVISARLTRSGSIQMPARLKTYGSDWLRRAFPVQSQRGRMLRRLRERLAPKNPARQTPTLSPTELTELPPLPPACDVLMQVENFESGGLENVVLDLCQVLTEHDYQVVLLVLGTVGAGVERAQALGIPVVRLPQDLSCYERLLAQLAPRLALTHYSVFGAANCANRGIPVIQVIHNLYIWLSEAERSALVDSASSTCRFIAVSDVARRYCVERLGLPPEKCSVIPNGIDIAPFLGDAQPPSRERLRGNLGIKADDFVFLSVGAINHQKNHIAAVEAFAIQASMMPKAKLVILGPSYEPELLQAIRALIQKKGLEDRVRYAGSAPSASDYYAMADALIIAAFFEGGPLTLLEAICANLPIVTARVGFAHHFDGRPGFDVIEPAVDIFDYQGRIWELSNTRTFIKDLADALLRTYQHPQPPNLPEDLLKAFDKRKTYQAYLELIEQRLSGQDSSGNPEATPSQSWPERLRSPDSTESSVPPVT
ncbi:MAG: glycosyltransferase [Lamprobacter sp.]|uniref:glycosyltransferase n=1 Tax=Lamprobacter sp. TaxID=3100796 RepID=UPI002B2632F9|nr:glycosyltransferase [Lamprobacter sp.]MEA3638325.1 glycosyltransferase [Lamprobacter sp.]